MAPEFSYCECPDCEFAVVVLTRELAGGAFKIACPICAEDTGRMVAMTERPALASDRPEGVDARVRPMPRFVCSLCERECLSPVSDEHAAAEFEALYGMPPDPERHQPICDDCFNKMRQKMRQGAN